MRVTAVTIKQFRCFESRSILFNKPFCLISGPNGSGKTSLLEALYYACYLRSFRTRTTRELIGFDESAFSLKLQVEETGGLEKHAIVVGYSQEKRLIKVNEKPLTSYKELLNVYRVIALTGDDTALIKGAPENRRHFLDQAIMLDSPEYLSFLKKYAGILLQRNALLSKPGMSRESYTLWTDQLTQASQIIRERRLEMIPALEAKVNELLKTYFDMPFAVRLVYKPKDALDAEANNFMYKEQAARYTLFGAHLDDYAIMLADKTSKQYASKGQQKLIALLLKVAQPAAIRTERPCIFVLDDLLSDFDNDKIRRVCALLASYKTQIIMTSPLEHPLLDEIESTYDCQRMAIDRQDE